MHYERILNTYLIEYRYNIHQYFIAITEGNPHEEPSGENSPKYYIPTTEKTKRIIVTYSGNTSL